MSTVQPLKIMHVVLSLEPGGLENGVVNVARALDANAFRVDVCCLERAGRFAARLPRTSGIYVLGKGEGFSLRAVYDLGRILYAAKPDVVHTHNLGNLIYGGLATGCGISRATLHSEHGELAADELSPRRLRQRRWLYRCCETIHTVSSGLRDHCALPNGVDTARFFPAPRNVARQQLGLDTRGPVFGIVGRFIPSKRHQVLLAAFERVAQNWTEAQLIMVGSGGSEHARIIELAKTSPYARRIHIAGFQENPGPYYQAMDLLVMPSIIEGMSNVALEAMACGVPALSHTSCGSAEVIESGTNGFLANLQSADLIVNELGTILASPERLAIAGQRARDTVVHRFSLDQMAQQYARLYLEAARKHRAFRARFAYSTGGYGV